MRVLGIDPSLTRTGVAYIDEDPLTAGVYSLPTTGRRDDGITDTADRIDSITQWALAAAEDVVLACVESPAYNTPGGSTWDRAGLWWHLVMRLDRRGAHVATVAPATRAKWATGRGHAPKAAVVDAMRRLWPSTPVRNDDEADALALATMAAQRLGWVTVDDEQAASLDVVRWPALDPHEGAAA